MYALDEVLDRLLPPKLCLNFREVYINEIKDAFTVFRGAI